MTRKAKREPEPLEPRAFYSDSRVKRVGDSVCLTFHATDSGDEVEVWMPLSSAGTAAMALLEVSFDHRIARTAKRRADFAAYQARQRENPLAEPVDWTEAEL